MRDRSAFGPYFRAMADRMGLKDWRIDILPEPPADRGDDAEIERIYGRRYARVRLADAFLVYDGAEQRRIVAHELIHLHLTHADQVVVANVSGPIYEAYRLAREYGIEDSAVAWSLTLPMPSEILDVPPVESPEKDHSTA